MAILAASAVDFSNSARFFGCVSGTSSAGLASTKI